MLDAETSADDSKISRLDLARDDHRYLRDMVERIKGIEAQWLTVLEKNFVPETLSRFSHLIRNETKQAESHGFNAVSELTSEIESTLIAVGSQPKGYTDSIKAYLDSCVSSLNRSVRNLIDEAVISAQAATQDVPINSGQHGAPRIYILDAQKNTAEMLAADLKAQGFKVFPIVDHHELERLCRLQKPAATLVVLKQNEAPDQALGKLQPVVQIDNGQVPCYVLSHQDNEQVRAMVASSGANSFFALPCYVPELAADIHSLEYSSLKRPMSLVVVGDSETQQNQLLASMFAKHEADLKACEQLARLSYIPKKQPVDGIVIADTGDEGFLTQCMALIGQDQVLRELPLAVVLKADTAYSESMMRLITVSASDVFSADVDKRHLVMRLQARTLQTRRKQFVEQYLKSIDSESGLMLRQTFYQQADTRMKASSQAKVPCSMIYVRLDYWREITEEFGVNCIGELKKEIAHCLTSVLGPGDLVTALSDNEYLILSSREETAAYRQTEWALKKQIEIFGKDVAKDSKLKARIGVSLVKDADVLKTINAAIAASDFHEEKSQEPLRPVAPILTQKVAEAGDESIVRRIKQAMDDNRLKLLFQPIVSMEGDEFQRYEVLMRMIENGQTKSPPEFLSDDTPANVRCFLDRWVVSRALKLMKYSMPEKNDLKFFIKLSCESICDESFISWLQRVVKAFNAPIERCVFELKEQTVIDYLAESQVFTSVVRGEGASVCIENFGAKKQSLKLLDYVGVDYLKLEKEYLAALGTEDERDLRFDSIIEKANQLDISTLAPFVETTSNLSLALQRGIALFQGYFLQPPKESMDFDFSMSM